MTINVNIDEPLQKEWIVRSDDSNAYSMMPTTLRSFSMTKSMTAKTNSFLRSINSKSALRAPKKKVMDEKVPQTAQDTMNIMEELRA